MKLIGSETSPLSVVLVAAREPPQLRDALRQGTPPVGQLLVVRTLEDGMGLVRNEPIDVALVDLNLIYVLGAGGWAEIKRAAPHVPFVALADSAVPHALAFAAEADIQHIVLGQTDDSRRVRQVMMAAMERKRIERQVELLIGLFDRLDAAQDFNEALAISLRDVCDHAGWLLAEAWMPDADREFLHRSHVWSASDEAGRTFAASCKHIRFKRGEGLPGGVWQDRQARILLDLTDADQFVRSDAARKAGISTAFAVPVLDGPETLAILVFFLGEQRKPDPAARLLVKGLARKLGALAHRQRARVAMETRLAALEKQSTLQGALLDSVLEHIYLYDRDMRYLFASPAGARALGMQPEDIIGRTWRDLGMPVDIMEPFEEEVRAVFATGRPRRGELLFPVVSGTGRYTYILTPVRGGSGSIDSVACTVRDETHAGPWGPLAGSGKPVT